MLSSVLTEKGAQTLKRRVLLLIGCVVAGCLVGAVGHYVFGSSVWFLAVPSFVIVAWLFVAKPTECLPEERRSSHSDSASL
jgi:uncharacterized membrane protein YgaE (UPF0421/DUF939 family)